MAGLLSRRVPLRTAVFTLLVVAAVVVLAGVAAGLRGLFGEYGNLPAIEQEIMDLEREVRAAPASAQAHFLLGFAYYRSGRGSEAKSEFLRALAIDPGHPTARYHLALLYYEAGELERAGELLAALAPERRDPRAYRDLGRVYLAKLDYTGAIASLKESLAIGPGAADVHYYLALAYRARGQQARAREELRTALRFDPEFAEARAALAAMGGDER